MSLWCFVVSQTSWFLELTLGFLNDVMKDKHTSSALSRNTRGIGRRRDPLPAENLRCFDRRSERARRRAQALEAV
jgi:hypothetical protein